MRSPKKPLALLVLLGSLLLPGESAKAAPASAPQAQTWDEDITLPAAGYRGVKAIVLDGDFQITLQPGAFIDHIEFTGIQKGQHWHLDGAFLRDVKLAVQLGSSFEATGSVFENCTFFKTGGWFTDFWGTKWRFENCVITRRFMTAEKPLSMGDYTVAAKDCTFIGAKLPAFELKKKFDYFQQESLRFENCRFVECAIPETFLAATVNCVFENCTFSTPRTSWPAATPPITVTGFYVGLPAPESYRNGPLTVNFSPAPKDPTAGARLPFTIATDHVVVKSIPEPLHFQQIATLRKKASELAP